MTNDTVETIMIMYYIACRERPADIRGEGLQLARPPAGRLRRDHAGAPVAPVGLWLPQHGRRRPGGDMARDPPSVRMRDMPSSPSIRALHGSMRGNMPTTSDLPCGPVAALTMGTIITAEKPGPAPGTRKGIIVPGQANEG
jgi:hypothetical protein